jgi:tetratricopeptide (TPR) repeat protein
VNIANAMFEKVIREHQAADEPAVLAKAHLNKNELISAIESGDKDKAQIIVQQMDSQLAGVSDKHDRLLLTVANDLYFRGRNIRKQNETKSNDYLVAAIQIFDSIIAKSNNGNYLADAYFLSGICYQETGNYEMAKGYYKTVSEKWPKSKYAREAKFRASKKVDEVYFNN